LPQLNLDSVIALLRGFSLKEKKPLRIILLDGLALHHYGMKNRSTIDIDAEVVGNLEALFHFLKSEKIPSDLSENISGWSVVAMPPGYRNRATRLHRSEGLEVSVLDPCDFVISKLRRFSEEDIEDALFVVKKYRISPEQIAQSAEAAIADSIKDATLFLFKKNVDLFLKKVSG